MDSGHALVLVNIVKGHRRLQITLISVSELTTVFQLFTSCRLVEKCTTSFLFLLFLKNNPTPFRDLNIGHIKISRAQSGT